MPKSPTMLRPLVIAVGVAIFCGLLYLPFYFLESAASQKSFRDREHFYWVTGMTMILWFPLVVCIAVLVTKWLFSTYWPRGK